MCVITIIIIIMEQIKLTRTYSCRWHSWTTEKGNVHSKVEVGDNVEGGEDKGNKEAELTVAMFQYFDTASALYLFSELCSGSTGENNMYMITDTTVKQLTDCSPLILSGHLKKS